MDRKTQVRLDARVKIIKALAHPTRLFMVDQVCCEEKTVGELTKLVGADMSTVSKHLSVLKNAGIVKVRKKGPQVYCSLGIPCIMNFFNCAEEAVQQAARELLNFNE